MLSLVSTDYFDDLGTPDPHDDIDYDGLRSRLGGWQEQVLDVRYEIRYRRVIYRERSVFVDFTYTASFQVQAGEAGRWARRLADNRLVLEEDEGDFRIMSGM